MTALSGPARCARARPAPRTSSSQLPLLAARVRYHRFFSTVFLPALVAAQSVPSTTSASLTPSFGALPAASPAGPFIFTFAGLGAGSYNGDGIPATLASLSCSAIAVDSAGNAFVADSAFNRVRKFGTAGVISTIAGAAGIQYGFSGDGGPATSAAMNNPTGVAVDIVGNVYIVDTYNQRVRKVLPNGTIHTVAGAGGGPAGSSYNGDLIQATAALLDNPGGIAVDAAGNLFIADTNNHRVRMVSNSTGMISTFAGNGAGGYTGDGIAATAARLNYPNSVAIDGSGNVYIADSGNHRSRKVFLNGTIVSIAGTGVAGFSGDGAPAIFARLNSPYGITVDVAGNVFIADSLNNRVRMVSRNGVISTVAGTGAAGYVVDGIPATSAALNEPGGVAIAPDGSLLIADSSNALVRKVTPIGGGSVSSSGALISTVAGNGVAGFNGDGIPATAAKLWLSETVAVDSSTGNVYIGDTYNQRIRKVLPTGVIVTIAGNGTAGYNGDGIPGTSAWLSQPQGIAIHAGSVYFADSRNGRVRTLFLNGTIATFAGNGASVGYNGDGIPATAASVAASGIAFDGAGTAYLADPNNNRVRRVGLNGIITTIAGTGTAGYNGDTLPASSAMLNFPFGIAVDATGNVFIADAGNGRIRVVVPNGTLYTVAGAVATATYNFSIGVQGRTASLARPMGVAVSASGGLFVADLSAHAVFFISPSGIQSVVAGFLYPGYNGEGVAASSAFLNYPSGVALDAAGNLYISEYGNNRVRIVPAADSRVSPSPSPASPSVLPAATTVPAGSSPSLSGTSTGSALPTNSPSSTPAAVLPTPSLSSNLTPSPAVVLPAPSLSSSLTPSPAAVLPTPSLSSSLTPSPAAVLPTPSLSSSLTPSPAAVLPTPSLSSSLTPSPAASTPSTTCSTATTPLLSTSASAGATSFATRTPAGTGSGSSSSTHIPTGAVGGAASTSSPRLTVGLEVLIAVALLVVSVGCVFMLRSAMQKRTRRYVFSGGDDKAAAHSHEPARYSDFVTIAADTVPGPQSSELAMPGGGGGSGAITESSARRTRVVSHMSPIGVAVRGQADGHRK